MELWLTVELPDGERRDVAVRAEPEVSLAAVVDAIRTHLGWPPVDPGSAGTTVSLGKAGLVDGSTLSLRASAASTSPTRRVATRRPQVELSVVAGPAAGRSVEFGTGHHVIGSAADADVTIPDPSVSRHHLVLEVGRVNVHVRDLDSTNGTYIGRRLAEGRVLLAPGEELRLGSTAVTISALDTDAPPLAPRGGRLLFNRPPRVRSTYSPERIAVGAPPPDPEKGRLALAGLVVPLPVAAGLALATGRVEMLLFALASPVVAALTHLGERTKRRRSTRRATADYRAELADARRRLAAALQEEAQHRRASAPDLAELVRRATRQMPSLWERWPDDDPFLRLRVGVADLPAESRLEVAPGGSTRLRRELLGDADDPPLLPAMPVTLDLTEGPVGIAADWGVGSGLARALILQVATLHSPRDVAVAAVVSPEEAAAGGEWHWLRWLPHARPPRPPVPVPLLASSPARVQELLSALARMGGAAEGGAGQPAVVLLVTEHARVDRAALAQVLADGRGRGVHVITLAGRVGDLPGECASVVEADPGGRPSVRVRSRSTGVTVTGVVPDGLPRDEALSAARALAPLVDTGASGAASVPREVRLLDLLGRESATTSAGLRSRWAQAPRPLPAPVGATSGGEPLVVDLVAQGPHALVAGMTGAGKSELLQAWVASLAATYPPDRLSLLLVDYKGGAAFRSCRRLPHTVGFVTDLDPSLARRAVVSLTAELERRKIVLAAHDASDWATLERRDPHGAPPRLLLVVDEFRFLREEVPDFVTGLVNIANQGRSLGIHLVLATQTPAGVVSEQMQSQLALRVSLRAGSPQDSTAVLGSPVAFTIDRQLPGRAYLRAGNEELLELQTAYAGSSGGAGAVRVGHLHFEGPVFPPEAPSEHTDLDVLVTAASAAAEDAGIPPQPSPWLPPLPDLLPLEQLPTGEDVGAVPLGLVDDPRGQRQLPWTVASTETTSIVVYGAARSGRSTFLRTLATALATATPPSRLHLYALDAGGGALTALTSLPHCAAVVPVDDEERVVRLLRLLDAEVTRRRQLPDPAAEPQLVLLLDGYDSLATAYETVEGRTVADRLGRLATSHTLGVAVVMTAGRQAGVPGRLAAAIPDRLVLRLAERHEYAALGLVAPPGRLPPGRGLTEQGLEVQVAAVGEDASPAAQASAIRAVGARLAQRWPGERAPELRILPADVPRERLPPAPGPGRVFLGLDDLDVEPVEVSVVDSHLLVAGSHRSGRSTALATIALGLAADPGTRLVALTPRRSVLRDLPGLEVAAGARECETVAEQLARGLDDDPCGEGWLVVVADDLDEIADGPAGRDLETLVRQGADRAVRVVAAAETRAAGTSYAGCLVALRRQKHALLLQPESAVDAEMLGARLPSRNVGAMPPGRGFLLGVGPARLVQVAR